MKTIVQEYGPIYGEPVNGTVQGRPNGSVYVPLSNVIVLEVPDDSRYLKISGANLVICKSDGVSTGAYAKMAAMSQDLASNIVLSLYSDDELTTLINSRSGTAGLFNISWGGIPKGDAVVTAGDTLYLRAQLVNNNTPVATSDTFELEVIEP